MKRPNGFTIVELLVVIVVIAILAVIGIVIYRNIQDRAHDSIVKQDLAAAAKELELVKVDLTRYPRSMNEFTRGFKFTKSSYGTTGSSALYCANQDTNQYALAAISKSGNRFLLKQGTIEEWTSSTAESVCQAVGASWASSSPVDRTAIHGFAPAGTSPNYIDGWNSHWTWTN